MEYLKAFVLGSSYLVFLPFFYTVKNSKSKQNYTYYQYTLVAPVWLGLWNVVSLIIANHFGLTKRLRFLIVSILSSLSIMCIAYFFKTYNFTNKEWKNYFFYIFIKYLLLWNIVVFYLDKYI